MHKRLSRLTILAVLIGFLLAPALPASVVAAAGPPAPAQQAAQTEGHAEVLRQASKALAAVIREVVPAVVHVKVVKTVEAQQELPDVFQDPFFRRFFGPQGPQQQPREFQQRGTGSGFIVSRDGYILTNNHVAGGADEISVKLRDGRELKARLVGTDPATDLAVIKVDAKALPVVQFGDARALEVGETVIAIGNPFGLEQTVTQGIVSAKGRSQLGLSEYEDFIQTDASINPGNSGGPLIDVTGKVVGVNTAIFSRSGGNMGIGFAIPIDLARHIMTALIDEGVVHRGFLGVSIQDVTAELAQALGIEAGAGVLVSDVQADSPAAQAGIRSGDLIVAFDGQPVRSVNELRVRVADVKPGSQTPVTVLRDGQQVATRVTLAERPRAAAAATEEGSGKQAPAGAPEAAVGLALQELTPQIAAQLGYQGQQGVLVGAVRSGSAAEEAGLQRGALIQQVNRRPVSSVAAFRQALAQVQPGQSLLLLVRQGPNVRYLALPVPAK